MEHGLLLLLSSPWLGLGAQHQAVGGGSSVWPCIPPVHCTKLPLSTEREVPKQNGPAGADIWPITLLAEIQRDAFAGSACEGLDVCPNQLSTFPTKARKNQFLVMSWVVASLCALTGAGTDWGSSGQSEQMSQRVKLSALHTACQFDPLVRAEVLGREQGSSEVSQQRILTSCSVFHEYETFFFSCHS